MRFKGLDLNLIVALDLLLTEKNVSRAAARLGLSQPAMSAALSRLREYFSDDLLVQHGKKLFVTSYAEGLQPHLATFLRAADTLIAASAMFDPATSSRIFRVITSDYIVVALFAPLVRALATSAPRLSFDFALPDHASSTQLQNGATDLLITPSEFLASDQPAEILLEERYVVVGSREHPLFKGHMTEEEIFGYGHVAVQIGAMRQRAFVDRHLDQLGKPRRIEVFTSSFVSVPWMLMGTERLALMHERLAREMVQKFPIRYAPLPFSFPVMQEMMQHHHARATDEGLVWLRAQLRARVAEEAATYLVDRLRSKQ